MMRRSSQSQGKGSSAGAGAGVHNRYDVYSGSNARALLACYTKARPGRPSKWDDAHKWLSRAPGDDGRQRSSGADDGLLLPAASRKETRHSWGDDAVGGDVPTAVVGARDEGQMKRMVVESECQRFASLCLRDVGTEMTPGGSKEPSRTNTPRAAAPMAAARGTHVRAPAALRREQDGGSTQGVDGAVDLVAVRVSAVLYGADARAVVSPATAWNEAERAKHMARYRREDLKIQAWENRERRKAELQMKMTEVKAERRKLRAREKAAGKLARAEAVAKEKRARAEAKLRRRAARVTGEGALLGRPRGRLAPSSSLSLKLPLLCS